MRCGSRSVACTVMANSEELFRLVRTRAERVAMLPERDHEEALAQLHGEHEASAIRAGMSRKAALEMANRLDTWIREALKLRPDALSGKQTLH